MKTRLLLTLAICVSLFASVQAQEFRYGLSGVYNYHSRKTCLNPVFMPD